MLLFTGKDKTRILNVEAKGAEQSSLLSENEKEQLLKGLDDIVVDLNKRNDSIQSDVKKVEINQRGLVRNGIYYKK